MLRRRLMKNYGCSDPSQAAPLEVAFYNGSEIVIREKSQWKNSETPIGIVVVPGYHNHYGDGTCGIMSLVGMDCNNPQTGVIVSSSTQFEGGDSSGSEKMYWGHYGTKVGNGIFSTNYSTQYYIPYQKSADSTATTVSSTGTQVVQWPYAGTLTSPASAKSEAVEVPGMSATGGRILGDFNGIKNTAACYVSTRTNSQWTGSTVKNFGKAGTPPAACAGRFKTVGTKSFYDVYSEITSGNTNYGTSDDTYDYKGMWYLPSLGELCYLPSKIFEINKTILALNSKYGNVGVRLRENSGFYWSSSEAGVSLAWILNALRGHVDTATKNDYEFFVRAFMRL